MSGQPTSFNSDSVGKQGEFHPSVPRSEPLLSSGHAPGYNVGNDAKPEFHAQTLPAGTAPKENTFKPNPINETPGQADNELSGRLHGKESTETSATDTLGGATSGDVYTGLGKPMQGQTAADDLSGRKEKQGLTGVGASGVFSTNQGVNERVDPVQRGLERESGDIAGSKVNKSEYGAEERPNVSSEELAAERP